jgi:vacuolar iron transporter family protein
MAIQDFIKKSFSFGLTSGIITTLGLMVGLDSSTNSKMVVLGGVLTIALADALSDAFGMHISEEAENTHTSNQIWGSTLVTFSAKLVFALTFAVPVLLLSLPMAMVASVGWALFLLGILSLVLARQQKISPWRVIGEHWTMALLVVALTYLLGQLIAALFGKI